MVLLDNTYHFSPKQDKTNFIVPFYVPAGYKKLVFTCAYSPKIVKDKQIAKQAIEANIGRYFPREMLAQNTNWEDFTPIVNLLTFSLDYQEEYIGCAHRHGSHLTHEISEFSSSPGFISHAICEGDWRAVINLHAVITPSVEYHLVITALPQEELA